MSANLKSHIQDINLDYVNLYFAKYMEGKWGVTVGYTPVPAYIAIWKKEVADWQLTYDCENSLCILSRSTQVVLDSAPVLATPGDCILSPILSPVQHCPVYRGSGDSLL